MHLTCCKGLSGKVKLAPKAKLDVIKEVQKNNKEVGVFYCYTRLATDMHLAGQEVQIH